MMSLIEQGSFEFPSIPLAPASDPRDADDITDDLEKDDTYYFTDVIFLVEGCLFRVPRQPLEHEFDVFRDMFQLPTMEGSIPDGMSDRQPLRLDGIAKADFRNLLRVLFPMGNSFDLVEWTSVLKLSTMWECERMRGLAIEKISAIDLKAADKLELAMRYDVKQWYIPTIQDLVCRPEPMGIEETKKIGVEYVLKIASIRERFQQQDYYTSGWTRRERGLIDSNMWSLVETDIREVFGIA